MGTVKYRTATKTMCVRDVISKIQTPFVSFRFGVVVDSVDEGCVYDAETTPKNITLPNDNGEIPLHTHTHIHFGIFDTLLAQSNG